jgi:hypothetical protein
MESLLDHGSNTPAPLQPGILTNSSRRCEFIRNKGVEIYNPHRE